MPRLVLDDEFRRVCREAAATNRTLEEWRQRESDDEFQSQNYVGGFDATEDAFVFSRYDDDGEWWFQLTLDQLRSIAAGEEPTVEMRRAN